MTVTAPTVDEIRWESPLTTSAGLLAWIEADPRREAAIVLALQELQRAHETRMLNLSDEERTRKVLRFTRRGKR
jgi:hypothetical protein